MLLSTLLSPSATVVFFLAEVSSLLIYSSMATQAVALSDTSVLCLAENIMGEIECGAWECGSCSICLYHNKHAENTGKNTRG